jgi:hypothetical protein
MSDAKRIVEKLLGEDTHELYDRLLAIGDELGEDSSVYQYIDLIADIYNGGIQQCIEHGRDFGEFDAASRFLKANGGPNAQALAAAFIGLRRSYIEAKEAADEQVQSSREGRGYDDEFDPYAEFAEDFDEVEDLLYNKEKTDAVHAELLSKLAPAAAPQAPVA